MDIECIATYECVNASFVMRGNDTIVFNPETCSWGDPPFCIQSQGGGGGGTCVFIFNRPYSTNSR